MRHETQVCRRFKWIPGDWTGGGRSVYRCEPKDCMGMERISIEAVLAFDPEIVVVQDRAAAAMRADLRPARDSHRLFFGVAPTDVDIDDLLSH
jgi:hypothetical protein